MKPYYQKDGITIYHGDCREVLPFLDIESLISDPPYGMKYQPLPETKGARWQRKNHDNLIFGDDKEFDPSHLLKYEKIILWGANHYANKLPNSRSWILWDKRPGMKSLATMSDGDMAWTNLTMPVRVIRHAWSGVIRDSQNGDEVLHPTEKPIYLMAKCIEFAKSKNVCDPYMGSGSALVAAHVMGIPAIGIEIDERYCEKAVLRLAQPVLFTLPNNRLQRTAGILPPDGDFTSPELFPAQEV